MDLRLATEADVDSLLAVQEQGAIRGLSYIFPQDTQPFPRDTPRARWLDEMADPAIHAYVITDDSERILGFAATQSDEFLHFGTAVAAWGTGLAAEAHDAVMLAFATDVARVRLRVFEENRRARRFYEKLGWQPTGHRTRTGFPPYPILLEYERDMRLD